jgi:predicted AAA+ superfamily ATPase
MEALLEKSNTLVELTEMEFCRFLLDEIHWGHRLIGIKGSRGAGKTTLMLQRIKVLGLLPKEAAFLSLDDLYFSSHTLVETAETFLRQGGKYLFLDEVHRYNNWAQEIKNLYDFYPQLSIVFTVSSIIEISQQEGDLSRRVRMYELPCLSFREYLKIKKIASFPKIELENIFHEPESLRALFPTDFRPYAWFGEYLKKGCFPFFLEDELDYNIRIQQTIRTIVEIDLPEMQAFDRRTSRKLLQLFHVLATQVPFKPNLVNLAQTIGIHRNSVLPYLELLEKANLIYLVGAEGKNMGTLIKPEKVFLHNPNYAFAVGFGENNPGTMRELFFVNQLRHLHEIRIAKAGDFMIDNRYKVEIGSKNKKFTQIADLPDSFMVKDALEFPIGKSIPIWIFGFLY